MNHPLQIVSIIVAIYCDGKYLLVQRGHDDNIFPGKWQNLGGKVELGERIEETIEREVKEEVGINVNSHPIFLQSYSWKKDKDAPVRLGLIYLIELEGKPNQYKIELDSELADYGLYSLKTIKSMNQKGKLIGKDSPTGTLGQLKKAEELMLNLSE